MATVKINKNWLNDTGIRGALEQRFLTAALVLEEQMKDISPEDTGNLKGSIGHEVTWDREGITARVGTNVEYAFFLEYGTGEYETHGKGRKTPWRYQAPNGQWYTTKGMKPQAFIYPSLKMSKKSILKILRGRA